MNITVNSQVLAAELRFLNKICAAKPTIPILGHVLIRAEDQLYLSATDLEVAMSTTCSAFISEMGELTLPAKALLDILEQLPANADVTVTNDRISSGTFKSRLRSLAADDFPRLPTVTGDIAIFSAATLRLLIERIHYAISEKAQKYVLDGALLSLVGDVIAMVSVDGMRLSVATASRQSGPDYSFLIPSKTLDILLAQTPVGDIEFSRSDNHLFFNYGKRLLISRVLEGKFPNYQRIIPKNNQHIVYADRQSFTSVLRRVGLVADATTLSVSGNTLELTSRSAEIGDADETMQVRYDGPDIRVLVNWKFVLDFLEAAGEPTITMALQDDKTPLLLSDGSDFINVVMLMRNT